MRKNIIKISILILTFCPSPKLLMAIPLIQPFIPLPIALKGHGIWHDHMPLRLHLGCGEIRFNGYVNVDFPPSEHTVQQQVVADCYADISQLLLPVNSVSEIRSHHVFEHFERANALSLLCQWHQWLKVGGLLVIETPDFAGCIEVFISPKYTYEEKQVIVRHIFGSHEARWAIHCDGWYKEKFVHILTALGFEDVQCTFTTYLNLRNIIVTAKKAKAQTNNEIMNKAMNLLRENMVDDTEQGLWNVWCKEILKVPMHIVE